MTGSQLTDEERELLDKTAEVYNAFWQLEDRNPADLPECAAALHRIQDMVMARPARRMLQEERDAGR